MNALETSRRALDVDDASRRCGTRGVSSCRLLPWNRQDAGLSAEVRRHVVVQGLLRGAHRTRRGVPPGSRRAFPGSRGAACLTQSALYNDANSCFCSFVLLAGARAAGHRCHRTPPGMLGRSPSSGSPSGSTYFGSRPRIALVRLFWIRRGSEKQDGRAPGKQDLPHAAGCASAQGRILPCVWTVGTLSKRFVDGSANTPRGPHRSRRGRTAPLGEQSIPPLLKLPAASRPMTKHTPRRRSRRCGRCPSRVMSKSWKSS